MLGIRSRSIAITGYWRSGNPMDVGLVGQERTGQTDCSIMVYAIIIMK